MTNSLVVPAALREKVQKVKLCRLPLFPFPIANQTPSYKSSPLNRKTLSQQLFISKRKMKSVSSLHVGQVCICF